MNDEKMSGGDSPVMSMTAGFGTDDLESNPELVKDQVKQMKARVRKNVLRIVSRKLWRVRVTEEWTDGIFSGSRMVTVRAYLQKR